MDCYDIIIDYYVLLHYFYDDLLSLHVDPLELRFFYHAYTKGELRTKYLLDYNVWLIFLRPMYMLSSTTKKGEIESACYAPNRLLVLMTTHT